MAETEELLVEKIYIGKKACGGEGFRVN